MNAVNGPEGTADEITLPLIGAVSARTVLVVFVAVAALLRIIWAARFGLSIDQEGAEYARIGENLLRGRGYVGIFNNGTQLNFPPLYPVLIATVSFFIGNSELAARAINIAAGALLVIPIFGIVMRLYGHRPALIVAVLVTFHPVLIAGGGSTYAEGPYLTLVMTAVYWFIKWIDAPRVASSVVAGLFFGLAYLVRPEAFLLAGVFAVCTAVGALWSTGRRPMLQGALGLSMAFLVVALPNIVFLTASTGKLRIEAKGTLAYEWGRRINSGMSYEEAVMGIGPDLTTEGVFMKPNLEVINSAAPTTGSYLRFLMTAARRNVRDLMHAVVGERAFGAPFLFCLVILGIFRQPWDSSRIIRGGIVALATIMLLAVLLTVQALWFRYFYPILGFLLIWAAKGAEEFGDWTRASALSVTGNRQTSNRFGAAGKWASVAAVLVAALTALPNVDQFRESRFPERASAGRWISTRSPQRPWVMDTGLQVTYYAQGDLKLLPYADSSLALRYIEKERPDYIVLHASGKSQLPYGVQWFDGGIPDTRAVLVYDEAGAQDHVKIYQWIVSPQARH